MVNDFAVYAEHSDSNKGMVSTGGPYGGWNRRVLNRTEVHPTGGSIRLEPGSGTVVLTRGIYHITAVSIVSYFEGEMPGGAAAYPARTRPWAAIAACGTRPGPAARSPRPASTRTPSPSGP